MGRSKVPMLHFYDHLTELCSEADQAVRKIVYLKVLIGNPIYLEKIDGSFSGFAPAAAKRAVLESVILFCARMWDNGSDTLSLYNIEKRIPPTGDIVTKQIDKNSLLDKASAQAQLNQRMQDWRQKFDLLAQESSRQSLRVFRNEWLAHRIHESHERISLGTGSTIKDLTYNEVVDQATQTVILIGELDCAVNRHSNLYPDRLEEGEKYCREFWRIVPVLKDFERL